MGWTLREKHSAARRCKEPDRRSAVERDEGAGDS
jgi:hypothetical protein